MRFGIPHFCFLEEHMVNERESVTAKMCAFVRAWHSNRSRQKIYDDYLAFDFMGKEEYDSIYSMISRGFGGVQEFSREEIDHPDTQRYKLGRIRELEWNIPKNVHFVPVDFEKERMCDKLIAAGFDPAKKTFFSILGVSYYLTLDVFADTLRQMAELSSLGSTVVFDYPIKTGDFPRRVARLEKITEELGEVMRGGFDYNEVSRALYSLGFQIDTYMPPEKVQKEYFDGRADGMRAFENVSLISATYTAGYNFE